MIEYIMTAKVMLTMEHEPGTGTSTVKYVDFNVTPSIGLDPAAYTDSNGFPTPAGSNALAHAFTAGLAGVIQHADQQGFRPTAEHLRECIHNLEQMVFHAVEVEKGYFPKAE